MSEITRVALDAMGGDNAPDANIKGAIKAITQIKADVTLIGKEEIIRAKVKEFTGKEIEEVSERLKIKNATETIEMEDGEIIKLELYPSKAPETVNNFVNLVQKGFYDGLIFHRVIKGFMIQGGCPLGNGTGNPGYSIKGEFSNNGFTNQLKHEAGVLSMARSMMPNSAGSQFFIMHKAAPHLDGEYAAFGKVIEGMDVVDKIASVKTFMDSPYEKQVMASVTVDTQGEEYPEPEKIEK